MNEYLELLVSLLAKTLNKPVDELKSIILNKDGKLNDTALSALEALDAERIDGLNAKNKGDRDNQYKRGAREVGEKWANDLRDAFGLDSEVKDEDLLATAKSKVGSGGDGGGSLTEDKVKSHPAYLALQKEKRDNEKRISDDWQKKFDDADKGFRSKTTRSSVNQKAIAIAKSLNLRLSSDPIKAQKQLELMTSQLDEYDFEPDGDSFVAKKNGEAVMDKHSNIIRFDNLVKQVATSMFDIEEGNGGKGSGTGNGDGFGKKFENLSVPKTKEELEVALKDAKSSEERTALSRAWLESQKPEKVV